MASRSPSARQIRVLALVGGGVREVAVGKQAKLSGQPRRMAIEAGIQAAEQIIRRAHADGIRATVTIGASFGCPFEGAVDPSQVLRYAEDLATAGADEIVLADTVGRVVLPPAEVQVGIMTAVVGVPAFLVLVRRGRTGGL